MLKIYFKLIENLKNSFWKTCAIEYWWLFKIQWKNTALVKLAYHAGIIFNAKEWWPNMYFVKPQIQFITNYWESSGVSLIDQWLRGIKGMWKVSGKGRAKRRFYGVKELFSVLTAALLYPDCADGYMNLYMR